jgi:hypothetical protein
MKGGNMKKQIILSALVLSVVGIAAAGVSTVAAQTTTARDSSLIQKIADKFKLNKTDVQTVFDQDRQEKQATKETQYQARLDQLVKDGKITKAQEKLILDKHKELESKRRSEFQNKQNLTADQRKAEMQQERTDLNTWATNNGIDIRYLMGGFGMGMHGHFRR